MATRAESRRSLLAKVHIAKKQLGMDDETYRQMLQDRFDVESARKLPFRQLLQLVRHMETLGAQFTKPGTRALKPKKDFYEIPAGTAYADQKRWIATMWHALGWKMSGLDVRAKKQFGVEKFVWLNDQAALQTLAKDLMNRCRAKGLDPENL